MSDSEGGGDSKFMTGFLIGFVVGVLVCLGVGGSFAVVVGRQQALRAARAAEMAERLRAEKEIADRAEEATRRAEQARRRAQEAEAKAKAKDKEGR